MQKQIVSLSFKVDFSVFLLFQVITLISVISLLLLTEYLTELNLSTNCLQELHPDIAKLTKLKFLDVSNNMLSTLPTEMNEMTSMREIALFNNRFCDYLELKNHE